MDRELTDTSATYHLHTMFLNANLEAVTRHFGHYNRYYI